jgi:Tol biopolymer transport system component
MRIMPAFRRASRAVLLLSPIAFAVVADCAELMSLRHPRVNDRITPNRGTGDATITQDGRFIAFASSASDIVPGDRNGRGDVFIVNLTTLTTRRVSLDPQGREANSDSGQPTFSGNGGFLAFFSGASNLVAGDTNDWSDIFVRDLQTGTITRVSVSSSGAQTDGGNASPALSADGRYVAFDSVATNLVPGDTNDLHDVFVRDRQTRTTTRVSITPNGTQFTNAEGGALVPAISADGRYVVFAAEIDNVYVHDRQTSTTRQVNVDSQGNPGTGHTEHLRIFDEPSISADGRYIAFLSGNTNLVPNDTNRENDIFLRDTHLNTTTRISVDSQGNQSTTRPREISDLFEFGSSSPVISADGRFVTFTSRATNLVPGDFNSESDIFVRDLQGGTTTRVSVDSNEQPILTVDSEIPSFFQGSFGSVPSGSGRHVVFASTSDFLSDDANRQLDVFVRDRQAGTTTLVSRGRSLSSTPSDGSFVYSLGNPVSNDGRYITFTSVAVSLVKKDTNGFQDVFVRDRVAGITRLASITSAGVQANGFSSTPSLSRNGRYIAFNTEASNLVPGASPGVPGIVIHDLTTRTVAHVIPNASFATLSDDGRFVAFSTEVALVAADRNGFTDIYLRDRQTGSSERVSARADGTDLNDASFFSFISGNGRYVAFTSTASNLVPGTGGDLCVFLYDRTTRTTTLIARSAFSPFVDVQGRYIAFASSAPDLVPGDSGFSTDVFVYDRVTQRYARMNETTTGEPAGTTGAGEPSLSGDGRYVAFESFDPLVNDQMSNGFNFYVRDRLTGAVVRAIQVPKGEGFFNSVLGSISGAGRSIVFDTGATTLVPADLNGFNDVFLEKIPKFPTVVRINAGGSAYTDVTGRVWAADSGFNTGTARRVVDIIGNTRDSSLYQDERYDVSAAPELRYSFSVPNGRYLVRLHFAETFPLNFTPGKRVFDVDIESTRRFSRLDVFAEAGARRALIKSSLVDVHDGRLDVLFGRRVNNPSVNAIEIIAHEGTP